MCGGSGGKKRLVFGSWGCFAHINAGVVTENVYSECKATLENCTTSHTCSIAFGCWLAIDKDRTMSGLERIALIHRDFLPTTLHAHACFSTLTQFSFTLVVVGDVRFSIFFVFSFHSVVYLQKLRLDSVVQWQNQWIERTRAFLIYYCCYDALRGVGIVFRG